MGEVKFSIVDQLDQLEEIVLEGSRIPFTGSRLVNEQEAIEILDAVREKLPSEFKEVKELLKQREKFMNVSKLQADEILKNAHQERHRLLDSFAIRHEAERQVSELKNQSRQQCEQLLQSTRQQSARMQQEMQSKLAILEQKYANKKQQLEQETLDRKHQLDRNAYEAKLQLAEQHEQTRQQSMLDVEKIRQEGSRLKNEANAEVERIHNDALRFRQQTQQQCESLIQQSRSEAATLQDGANRYAEQTLGELEQRLNEMNRVVIAGRRELGKVLAIKQKETRNNQGKSSQKTVPFIRNRKRNPQQQEPISGMG